MKPKFLYHGSAAKLLGEKLVPRKAKDVAGNVDNSHNGVYAPDFIVEALAMGILKSKGVKGSSIGTGKFDGIPAMDAVIYGGTPKQKFFYLYTLPSKTFKNIPKGSFQWVSHKPVKPVKIERFSVKNYLHLIRRATKKEKEDWDKNYGGKK